VVWSGIAALVWWILSTSTPIILDIICVVIVDYVTRCPYVALKDVCWGCSNLLISSVKYIRTSNHAVHNYCLECCWWHCLMQIECIAYTHPISLLEDWLKGSVSNSSRPSRWVRVQIQTEPLPNCRSGLPINLNLQLEYGSMMNSQPVWIGQVVSGSPSGFIYRFNNPRGFGVRNSILSKSCFQQPMISSCILCSLQYRLIWNQCCTFDILYLCQSWRSLIPFWSRRSAWCPDYQICTNYNYWRSVDAH